MKAPRNDQRRSSGFRRIVSRRIAEVAHSGARAIGQVLRMWQYNAGIGSEHLSPEFALICSNQERTRVESIMPEPEQRASMSSLPTASSAPVDPLRCIGPVRKELLLSPHILSLLRTGESPQVSW
ncbi:hypothetical protein N7468_009262 [Penicillium chermesinum]|uniref:Uncharacterized protein n=1 Tax=Penicillium chermesinum TaxID=63820 RepID=A0A9W9NK08_9EURO|nr:uncharacterized protein N7468_009262 [Penicillium chermesinum]KAJ5220058.1 hypothetical protein N7468_009262 [Penicillium chermesinum]